MSAATAATFEDVSEPLRLLGRGAFGEVSLVQAGGSDPWALDFDDSSGDQGQRIWCPSGSEIGRHCSADDDHFFLDRLQLLFLN